MTDVRKEYSNALFRLAQEEELCGVILDDIKFLKSVFNDNPGYYNLLSAPNIKRDERISLIDEAFSQNINIYTLNFLKIMVEQGYFYNVKECFDEYIELYNKANNIEVITAVTPVPLSAAQKEKLKDTLANKLSKNIELIEKTDPSLIGGIRLEMKSRLIDSSINSRLDGIRAALNSTVL
ncbi:MAG: F0F1 ATP synthase subunit delta, partial [Clostridia bacterium]|nr:F0F1 ATP synthase subunit delta [Clostridia bacterium]